MKTEIYQEMYENNSSMKKESQSKPRTRLKMVSYTSADRKKLEKQLNKYIEENDLEFSDVYDISIIPVSRETHKHPYMPYVIESVITYQLSIIHKKKDETSQINQLKPRARFKMALYLSTDRKKLEKQLNRYIEEHQNEIDVIFDVHANAITKEDWYLASNGYLSLPEMQSRYITKYVVSLSYKVKQEV